MKYLTKGYLNEFRLMAYIEQYKYIKDNDRVLEIGNGAGMFREIVNKVGKYKVLDIDRDTKPDFLGDIADNKWVKKFKNKFDVVFCCQVLEHMPIERAKKSFQNIIQFNAELVVISIPDIRKSLRFRFDMPRVHFSIIISIQGRNIEQHINNNPYHYWALSSKNKQIIYVKM